MKSFKQITEAKFSNHDHVARKSNPRHHGQIYQINRTKDGDFAHVKWNNGWKEHNVSFHELEPHTPESTNQYVANDIAGQLRGTKKITSRGGDWSFPKR